MGFDAVLRGAIGTLNTVFGSMQTTVTIFPFLGQDGYGKNTWATTGIPYRAIVEYDPKVIRERTGVTLAAEALVLILQPIPPTTPNAGQTRENPIDKRDKIVLPGGKTGPIIGTPGLLDPTIDRPYFSEIVIGKV